jgi:hypothetical protein
MFLTKEKTMPCKFQVEIKSESDWKSFVSHCKELKVYNTSGILSETDFSKVRKYYQIWNDGSLSVTYSNYDYAEQVGDVSKISLENFLRMDESLQMKPSKITDLGPKQVINCPTKEDRRRILELAQDSGFNFSTTAGAESFLDCYYDGESCLQVEKNKRLMYGSKEYFLEKGFEVLKAEDFPSDTTGFTKSDLKPGDVVVKANGWVYMVIGDNIASSSESTSLGCYGEDLTYKIDNSSKPNSRIDTVYRCSGPLGDFTLSPFRKGNFVKIWSRKVLPEVYIGTYKVEFLTDSIRVGCQKFTKEQVKQIYEFVKNPESKAPALKNGDIVVIRGDKHQEKKAYIKCDDRLISYYGWLSHSSLSEDLRNENGQAEYDIMEAYRTDFAFGTDFHLHPFNPGSMTKIWVREELIVNSKQVVKTDDGIEFMNVKVDMQTIEKIYGALLTPSAS